MSFLHRYARWLHTQWPAGRVEQLPEVDASGRTNVPGVYVIGDLRGVPLLKFAIDSGVRAVRDSQDFCSPSSRQKLALDLVIIGAGVAGLAAAVEARRLGMSFRVIESNERLSTLVNFPKGKPIFTFPKDMTPEGALAVTAQIKETLLEELLAQTKEIDVLKGRAVRVLRKGTILETVVESTDSGATTWESAAVLIAIGRSGNFRKLGIPGETLDKVYNRLHDPKDFTGREALVVGGGDSALETAIALDKAGASVTLSYRSDQFARAKPDNVEALRQSRVKTLFRSDVLEIQPDKALIKAPHSTTWIPNDVVFTMLGREAPLDFFRRSGIRIVNEWTARRIAACAAFIVSCYFLFSWKSGGWLGDLFYQHHWWPVSLANSSMASILRISASSPGFWYTLVYSVIVVVFGIRRIRRRRTPYVTWQTLSLMFFQVLPLFLLPEIILPWLGAHHLIPTAIADSLFPVANYGHGREYWRAYGFILAWPLMVYNVFTQQPLWGWLAISFLQTFVLIPVLIYFFGKGAYCGWICSCGGLAETLGDAHRHKMPHGPGWNRLNMAGQAVLVIAFLLLGLRIWGWIHPGGWADQTFWRWLSHYKWGVDVTLGGILGIGFYFWASGRVWCRFFCPLAALMHLYARFSRFRIFARKERCISCNVCTSVCHQGIDVMGFANKGLPMEDPQCVRCSACVQQCPTDVLQFGRADRSGRAVWHDRLPARALEER